MEGKAAMVPGGRRCSRMARKDPPAAMRECSGFEGRNCHTLLRLLPEDLVFEILVRLPAKSVARFRCISTAWLSITTDPFFILAHARRAPKSLLVRSIPIIRRNGNHFPNLLFSFSLCGFFCCKRRLDHLSDEAISSLDGLVLFCRNKDYHPCESNYYVINPLIGLRIDLPHLNRRSLKNVRTMDLYYHRWTGEYRLLNLNKCIEGPDNFHMDAEVLSLGKASSSWRQIKDKAPLDVVFNNHRRIQVNDCFYWTGQESIDTLTILVFDILKETFSLMEFPSYSQKSTFPSFAVGSCLKYGLVDIEGILCLYCVYRDKSCVNNVMIDIWAATDDGEKWKNTHSLCLVNEWRWAHSYSFQSHRLADFCFCFREKELMFLFDGGKGGPLMDQIEEFTHYLFHWNLKSGKYRTMRLLSGFEVLRPSALICKETLITAPFSHTIVTN